MAEMKRLIIGDGDFEIVDEEARTNIASLKTYVTPEMFGAVGDGVIDDSAAIQRAINSGWRVMFNSSKTYAVNNTITVGAGMMLSGDWCTLKGSANPLILVQTYTESSGQEHSSSPVLVEKFRLEGNETNTLLSVHYATKTKIANIDFRKMLTGIVFDGGYENVFDTLRFYGTPTTGATGLHVKSGGDSIFNTILGCDCKVGIQVDSGHNVFRNIHFWIKTSSLYDGSSMIYDTTPGGAANVFEDAYFDTYQRCYYKTGLSNAIFNNPRYLNSDSIAPNDDSVLFYVDNAEFVNTYYDRVRFEKLITSLAQTTRCVHASNQHSMPLYLTFMPTNAVQQDRLYECNLVTDLNERCIPFSDIITLNSGYTIKHGAVFKKDRHIYGDLVIESSNTLYAGNSVSIGTMNIRPYTAINTFCGSGTTEYRCEHIGYLYYVTNMAFTASVDGDKFIKIHLDYTMAF